MANRNRSPELALAVFYVAVALSACGTESSAEPAASAMDRATTAIPGTTIDSTTGTATATTSTPGNTGGAVSYVGPLIFDWPTGCDVIVTETVDKDGETAQFVYPVYIREIGADIEIDYGELDVVHVRGNPLSPEQEAQMAALFALPSITVGADGRVVSISGVDDLLADMQELGVIGELPDRDAFVAVVEESVVSKYWGSWVGRWAEWPEITGELLDDKVIVPVGDEMITYDLRRESVLPADNHMAHLRDTTTIEGPEFARFLAANRGAISGGTADSSIFDGAEGEKVTIVEAVLDPTTLRPATVTYDDRSTATLDGETTSRFEVREWAFDWSSPSCS